MEKDPKASLLGVTHAAQVLGVSSGTIRNLEARGELRAFRDTAGRRLFFPADVERLREERQERAQTRSEAKAAE